MLSINDIKNRMDRIEEKLNKLDDEYDNIQNTRKEKGLSLAIYKCNDKEALKLIEIDEQIKNLENTYDRYEKILKQLKEKEYKKEVKEERQKQEGYKYKIISSKKVTYSNSFLEELKKCIKNKIDCIVFEYSLDTDNLYNKEINKPFMWDIYRYNSKNNSLTTKVNNSCYKSFVEHKKYFDSNIYYHHVTFYDNSNNELGYFMHNIFGQDILCIHNNFGSNKYKTITIVKENGHIKDRKIIQNNYELLNNTLIKISKNKNYKYNIDFYKNFLGIELR